MEPDRVPCCITGCRRTFKREVVGESLEYLCGKHFRCDPDLLAKCRRHRKRVRRVERLFTRLARKATSAQIARMDRIWDRLVVEDNTYFQGIRLRAQAMQDAGYWARRRSRRVFRKPASDEGGKMNMGFEREFQRLKQTQVQR